MSDLPLEETQIAPRRGLSLGSIVLLVGIVLTAAIFGLALARQNQTQPTAGPAPNFSITTYDGQEMSLTDLRGKVVVVNFWASWCGPCRVEAPDLQQVWENYRDRDVVMIGIAYTDTDRKALAFIEEFGITYPNAPDLGTRISDAYHITGVPETFIIDRDGNITHFFYAPTNEQRLSAILDRVLSAT